MNNDNEWNLSCLHIRRAEITEEYALTKLSLESKHYWNYPKEYFHIFEKELTLTAEYIINNLVYLAEYENKIIGYFSIVNVKEDYIAGKVPIKKGFWLEHIFIRPGFIRRGIGSLLMAYAKSICSEKGISALNIFSDPNARGFYETLGANYKGEYLSGIECRTVSYYEWEIASVWMDKKGYIYKNTKAFTEQELKELFSSVGWISANYADRLVIAVKNSSTVLSVWDKDKLIGLINALDDGELTAYVHYLLIRPEYQKRGIGRELLEHIKKIYESYLYLVLISEEKDKVGFYEKLGFIKEQKSTPMIIMNSK